MSDILSDLWKSLEKSFQDGAGGPSIGPSVGRGLFSNPFLSEHDRDVRDLRTLHGRVRSAYERSLFVDEARFEAALLLIFKNACEAAEYADYRRAIAIAYAPLSTLLRDEFFSFPDLADEDFTRLTLRDLSELRAFLLRKDAHLHRAEAIYDLACRAAQALLVRILEAACEGLQSSDGDALQLEASALETINDPASQIEYAWRLPFAQELEDAHLFEEVRAQLRQNTLIACRIDPNDPHATNKVVPPTQAKGRDPSDLAAAYLGGTPLAGLFDATLPISISDDVRFEHTHILGGSGHGKTQLLLHLIHHDLARADGPGLIVIDSQGDLIRTLARLDLFSPRGALADRLVLIDPTDIEYPFALSLFDVPRDRLAAYGPAERERLLNGAIEMYEYVFSSLLGAELTQKQGVIFRFLARLMMAIPGATLHTFLDLMEHGERFRPAMATLDGTARRFFDEEFFHPSFAATKKQIAKRLWGILANPVFERMFSQPQGKLDVFEALQQRKIILVSTAKDALRQDGAEMFGRFLIAKITQAVMERAALAQHERTPAFIYIDEAHEYVDDHLALLLNQARKFRVGLTLAHQNLDQLPPTLRASVMSSTSVKLAGGVSAKDARSLADEFGTDADFIQSMRKRRGRTHFACHIRNQTPRAAAVSIPLGAVNALPQLSEEDFAGLIAINRARYCVHLSQAVDISAAVPRNPPPPPPPAPDSVPTAPIARDAYVAGQGGKDHKYVQHLLRAAAHERGLKADIEWAIPGGSVDIAFEAAERRIACEISITTDAEHEAGNVKKCLAAGFDAVWIVAPNGARKPSLAKRIAARFADQDVSVLTVEDALLALDALAAGSGAEADRTVRGYKVRVRHSREDAKDAQKRREAVAAILARSLRAHRD